MKIWCVNPIINTTLVDMFNESGQHLLLNYYAYLIDSNAVCATLNVDDYFIYSEPIPIPSNDSLLCIQIRRINNIYEIKLERLGTI